jgi:hypothetical protein
MIDFDALVLSPCEDIFAIAALFTLVTTSPASPPILARGVYSSGPIDVLMQDDILFQDHETSLGIRARDFDVPPGRGDTVEITEPSHPAYGLAYWIGDAKNDGQGGIMLLLRTQRPLE